MERFEIHNFWDETHSHVKESFDSFPPKLQARIVKRIEIFERKTVMQLFKEGELEKVTGAGVDLYELRIRVTPPVRMLGILERNVYRPFSIFVKKDERIRLKEIRTAGERIKEYYKDKPKT